MYIGGLHSADIPFEVEIPFKIGTHLKIERLCGSCQNVSNSKFGSTIARLFKIHENIVLQEKRIIYLVHSGSRYSWEP